MTRKWRVAGGCLMYSFGKYCISNSRSNLSDGFVQLVLTMMNTRSTAYSSGLVFHTTFPKMSLKMEISSRRMRLSVMLSIC
jgi:hypothetical protein